MSRLPMYSDDSQILRLVCLTLISRCEMSVCNVGVLSRCESSPVNGQSESYIQMQNACFLSGNYEELKYRSGGYQVSGLGCQPESQSCQVLATAPPDSLVGQGPA